MRSQLKNRTVISLDNETEQNNKANKVNKVLFTINSLENTTVTANRSHGPTSALQYTIGVYNVPIAT